MMFDVMASADFPFCFKMKRVKHEQIQSTVNHYLKRRQYMESESVSKRETRGIQQITELALHGCVNSNGNTENVLAYSSISGDATACDQQFTRLKHFIQDAVDPYRGELKSLLFPLFVHVYLELLCNGHKTPAHKFHDRHVALFKEDDNHKIFIRNLKKMDSKMDVLSSKDVSDFRENKFTLHLSESSLNYLMRYLKLEDNMMMLQIFNHYFQVEVKSSDECNVELKETGKQESCCAADSDPSKSKSSETELSMAALKQCIDKVRSGPPCMSSICMYTFLNAYQGLCCASVSPNGELLSAGFEDSSVSLWSLVPGHIHTEPSASSVANIALSADLINIGEGDNDVKTGCDQETIHMHAHSGAVYRTCFTPESQYLLSCSEDATVRLWDLKSHSNIVCYRGHNSPVWDMDTSAASGYFASCSHDRTAKLWCTERTYPLRSFIGHTFDVDCVKFHPNGNYLATGSGDKTVRLWSSQDGRTVRLLQGHQGSVMALAFSPDGKLLASAGEDRRVRVWDLSSGQLLKELRGHTDTVYSLSFNRSSSILVSGGLDSVIMAWDVTKTQSSEKSKDSDSTTVPELLNSYPTKSVSVIYLEFSQRNILLAAGTNL